MFLSMQPASDLDRNYGVAAPTIMIESMTLAGE
jgi:PmbA protein